MGTSTSRSRTGEGTRCQKVGHVLADWASVDPGKICEVEHGSLTVQTCFMDTARSSVIESSNFLLRHPQALRSRAPQVFPLTLPAVLCLGLPSLFTFLRQKLYMLYCLNISFLWMRVVFLAALLRISLKDYELFYGFSLVNCFDC